jgi:hypothetical protein
MAKKKRQHAEQLRIVGTERLDRVPKLDEIAEEARDVDDQIKGLTEHKGELAEQLVAEMQDRNLERYVYEGRDGKLYELSLKELEVKATIKRYRKPQEENAGAAPEASN